jgi:hypothetical protein
MKALTRLYLVSHCDVKVSKGEIVMPDIPSWTLRSPASTDVTGNMRLDQFEMDDDTDFDRPNRSFVVNSIEDALLATWLAKSVFTATNRDPAGHMLYVQQNVSQMFDNIAISMTTNILSSSNATMMLGTLYREETYIKVTCPWLILPGMVVIMNVVLLTASNLLRDSEKQGL